MITIEAQQKLLLNIARRLKKPITAYAIGGTAMMFLGLKESTLDIDLVFETEDERKVFKQAVKEIGYQEMDAVIVYGTRMNRPEMFTLGDERFDLFLEDVIDFIFSKEMKKRAEQTHQFNNNLFLKVANPHDLILMKCATDRLKDLDDARRIIESTKIDWKLIVEEAEKQIQLGKHDAAFELGEFIEKLRYKLKLDVPIEILDKIYDIVMKQVKEKKKKLN